MEKKRISERYLDFVRISSELICEIIKGYDKSISVSSHIEIDHGRANSNYIINTDHGKMVLRVCRNQSVYDNEIIIDRELDLSISRPKLLYHTIYQDKPYLLYQYIESESLGNYFELTNDIVKQVAKLCAHIHNTPIEKLKDISKLELPPFESWYDHFLDNPNTVKRIGPDLQVKLKAIVLHRFKDLKVIDTYHSVIHNDFRLDNMIIDSQNKVFITDWEGVTVNHKLTDMGQFFRFSKRFTDEQRVLFEEHYNIEAQIPLPSNWIELSKLRDLVNLLQLISSDRNLPNYNNTLNGLICDFVLDCESKN